VTARTHPRTLAWDGCVNVRDLGGLPTEDGGETQHRRVIRADNIGALSEIGWRRLVDDGVVRIVDLRWPEEVAADPPRSVDVEVVQVSVLGESLDRSMAFIHELDANLDDVEDVGDHYAWSYVQFLERHPDRFARALTAVVEVDGPVVIHCMGGKDRTGLVAALLLRLAGVATDTIGHDYAMSGPNLAAALAPWIEQAPTAVTRRRRALLSQTPAAAMHRVIEAIEARHDTVAGYLAAAGLSPAQIEQLQRRLR
jgi:protein-tyrosine phosphatase